MCFVSQCTKQVNILSLCFQIAWALNKGIKAEYKQYWDVELGVTYIPWSKVREEQVEELKEGGILDIDSLAPGKTSSQFRLNHKENSKKQNTIS